MDVGWVCLIYLIGLTLVCCELFVPGIFLGVLGIAGVGIGIFFAFYYHSPFFGIALVAIALVLLPLMFVWGLKRLTLGSSQKVEEGYTSADEKLEDLVGKSGITLTPLRPSGVATIENRRIDVTAEMVMLEKDTPIQVVKVEGCRVVVRATGSPQKEE